MGKQYQNPPIVEALCEFQFISDTPWSDTFHELFYEKIKRNFPTKQKQVNFGIEIKQDNQSVEYKQMPATERMQFLNESKVALVQLSPDILTINHLKPYPNWEKFKPSIIDTLKQYCDVVNPKGLKRIGLRYINKIDIKEEKVFLENYFNFFPKLPDTLPKQHGNFNIRIEFSYEKDKLLLTFGTIVSGQADVVSFIFDLDYNVNIPTEIKFENIDSWLDKAHKNIEDTFEACITDKCKMLFGD